MKTFTIDFTYSYGANQAMFMGLVDDAGNQTPLIGRFGGVDFFCFHRLVQLTIAHGFSSLDPHHSLAISREGARQLGRLAQEHPGEMMELSDRFDLRTEKTSIQDCRLSTDPSAELKLDREATVIRPLEGGYTYVREIWGPGKLRMSWTEYTCAYRNGRPIAGSQQSGPKETALEEAHVRATYVLDENGVPATTFVRDIRDEDGRQLLFREDRQISDIELLLHARMAQPFAGVDPYVWGEGRFEGQPLVKPGGGRAWQVYAIFSPLQEVRMHGTTRSGFLN
ncbi:hypothetical protein PMI15_01219 [Polaromonas sp. CF318]|uniref:hypothetical protein n=1 Tax=Polaromonas sp. CF318 TaxID=1144318 RepID=UPI000270DAFD|nr:hypothetical protein [Polaromonas sp. CF318]EJL87073.1 hypothetical protein PMI15_01219 [Polaromonas sp. CF318]